MGRVNRIPYLINLITLSIIGSITSAGAYAEQKTQETADVEKLIVTGSRIPRKNLVSAGAVTVIDQTLIEASPYKNIGDILQTMTVSQPTENSLSANGSGAVRLNLRGIGTNRTLVLLNSKRLPYGGKGADSSVDLGAIPTSIVERVEVLLDGASAIYGSDAIAGVVNIITKKDFEGLEVGATYGNNTDFDGSKKNIELVSGFSGDKGNVTFSASYAEVDAIYSKDIPFSAAPVALQNDGSLKPDGSYWLPWTAVTDLDGVRLTQGPNYGEFHPYTSADSYNYFEQSFLQQPTEVYNMSTFANYDIGQAFYSEDVGLSFEVMYTHRNNDSNSAAQPLIPWIGGYDDIQISKDNYYNQEFGPKDSNGQSYDIFKWSKRMNEFGPRQSRFDSNQYHIALGLHGDINDVWSWQSAYTFGRYESQETREGVFNWDRVREAVGPTFFDESGVLRCGTGPQAVKFKTSTCVPLNVFIQPGESQPEGAMEYVSGDWSNVSYGYSSVKTATFDLTGVAMSLPAGDLGIATGVSYMEFAGLKQTDSNAIHAMTTDGNGRPTGGSYNVSEAYIELNIPIFSEQSFAESLELNIASRYSDYSTGAGSTVNSKASIFWAINNEFSVRSTISQAFRAANIQELYKGQLPSFENGTDPCKTGAEGPIRPLTPENDAGCLQTGAPASGFRDGLDMIRTNTGGNPDLEPETAVITTLGLILRPEILEGFSFTLDYYDIELDNTISTFKAQRKIELCNETGAFCDDIHRYQSGPLQGVLLGVDTYNENLNASHYRGVDSEAFYKFDNTQYGDFKLALNWHHALKHEISIFDGGSKDYVGTDSSNGGFQPKNKVNFSLNWQYQDWAANWFTYYLGEAETEGREEQGQATEYTIKGWSYSNINISYHANNNMKYGFGVNNVFNTEPRRVMRRSAGNTNSIGAYSAAFLGTTFYVEASYSF